VLPLSDEPRPEGYTPFVGWGVILLEFVVYGLTTAQAPGLEERLELWHRWAFTPAEFDVVTLFTSMFLHANPVHLVGNMLYLWIFSVNVEWCLGHVGFAAFYVLTGVAGTLVYAATADDPTIPVLGASGAISGVLGVYLVAFPRNRIRILWWGGATAMIPAWAAMIVWFGWQDLVPIVTGSAAGDGVGHWAHLGAFACGTALAFVLKRWIAARDGRPAPAPSRAAAGTWEKYLKR
jgi:membrane associated rhomboid family serine protease